MTVEVFEVFLINGLKIRGLGVVFHSKWSIMIQLFGGVRLF